MNEDHKARNADDVHGKIVRLPQGTADDRTGEDPGALPVMRFPLTQMGNAERLVSHFGEHLLYCEPWRTWLEWDGQHWHRITKARIRNYAQQTVRRIRDEAATARDIGEAMMLLEWAEKSEATSQLHALIAQAESLLEVAAEDFDAPPHLLCCTNGVVNVVSGEFRATERSDRFSRWAPVAYDPHAECPVFDRFVRQIMDDDEEMVAYLLRLLGYCATGSTAEQMMPLLFGQGNNGKGVLVRVVQAVLGKDYAMAANPDFMRAKRYIGHPTEIKQLMGKRLVVVPELAEGEYLDEARLKVLTGGDWLRGRDIAKGWEEWVPSHKLLMATNHLPKVKSKDPGTWRRLRVIRFKRQWALPGAEHVLAGLPPADPHLEMDLATEYPGILHRIIQGAVEYHKMGLAQPQSVTDDTLEFQKREDRVGVFLQLWTHSDPGGKVTATDLYEHYRKFCSKEGDPPLGPQDFSGQVRRKGYRWQHDRDANYYYDLALVHPVEEDLKDVKDVDETPEDEG